MSFAPIRPALQVLLIPLALTAATAIPARAQPTEPGGSVLAATSFESARTGAFVELQTEAGLWRTPAKDHAEITDQYAFSGDQCLHLFGGDSRMVVWTPAEAVEDAILLGFRAERWTAREPFGFRIEALEEGEWRLLYTGDETIRVGRRFLSQVEIELADRHIEKFRFVSTSPEKSGILIDDIEILKETPMTIESCTIGEKVTPVLIRNAFNPLQRLTVRTNGFTSPPSVTAVTVDLSATDDLDDIESVSVFYSAQDDPLELPWSALEERLIESLTPFGEPAPPAREMRFEDRRELVRGDNHFVVSCVLKDGANLFHKVAARIRGVRMDGEDQAPPFQAKAPLNHRIGHAVRKSGDDDSRGYRIPGLATTNEGTLIGVYDIRYDDYGDLPGRICVGMSRSMDRGDSWQPMQVIMDMGDHDRFDGNGVGDPAVLVDRGTNTIWVAALWSHGPRGFHGSGPGLSPEETGQLMLVRSNDDGLTWSEPINITEQVKRPEWRLLLQGPGKGITLRDGTLVFAAQFKTPENVPYSTIIYSKDHGETWSIGTGAMPDTTEAQVVELGDGNLMLNMRTNRSEARGVMTTGNLGGAWWRHASSLKALVEPGHCMASLIRRPGARPGDKSLLFFSNPASPDERRRMTIKVSEDGGRTWPEARHLLLDEGLSAGYSCLTLIDDETVGILYEGSRAPLTFEKIRVPWWGAE